MAVAVNSSVYFLERSELWESEKPFLFDYAPEPPALKSNATVEREDITVEDTRGRESDFTYEKNGFFLLQHDFSMEATDFDDDKKVKEVYLRQVGDLVKEALGASRVQIYDYIVS